MKAFFIIAALAASSFVSAQKTFNLKDFKAIDVHGNIEIKLVKSSENKLVVDKGDAAKLIVDDKGNSLHIEVTEPKAAHINATLYYSAALENLSAASGSEISSDEILKTSALALNTNSGAEINLKISASKVSTVVESGSKLTLSGTAESHAAVVNSGSGLYAKNLVAATASLVVSSGAVADINATTTISVTASSGAKANVYGKPAKVNKTKSSGGRISVK
jgi:hypothetical protein